MAKKRKIEDEIKHILTAMETMEVDSAEYRNAVDNLKGLCEAKNKNLRFVTPDTIVLAVTNIVGIVLIMSYERVNVIATKAFNLLVRRI